MLLGSRSLKAKGTWVANTFYERPILNSPYEKPRFHHPLDERGQPLGLPSLESRRPSKSIVPVP
jgi:type III restriction enzyme